MPGKLDAALAWAARGLRVFPLRADSKFPLEAGWTISATTDPAVVRAMWTHKDPVTGAVVEHDHNVGFLTSHHVVLDVDMKGGKPGLDTFFALGLDFDTLVTRTPTGGYHLIYRGIGREVGGSPLGLGVDVRGLNGYIVAPGSEVEVIDGDGESTAHVIKLDRAVLAKRLENGAVIRKETYVVEIDAEPAEVPHEIRPLLKAPRARRGDGVSVELDQPEAVEMAAHWLRREAPPAVEGENGDDHTYRVACRARDLGLSEAAALDLMLEEWNPRCEPPWDADELARKVENAYRYATGGAGAVSPETLFSGVVPVEIPVNGSAAPRDMILPGGSAVGLIRYGNMTREENIEKRPWVVEGLLMEGVVTELLAPGGTGKSLLSLIVGAHLAVGKPFWGFHPKRAGKSVIYNAEDDLMEASRRLSAICRVYELDIGEVSSKICLLGRDDLKLKFTKNQPPQLNEEHVAVLRAALEDPDVVLLSVDPLVSAHTAKENDAIEMEFAMDAIRDVARPTRTPVLVVHHTAKPPTRATSMSGEQDAGRGSTAIAAAARVILTMSPAKEDECLTIGVPLADRKRYVRLEGAKVSYGANDSDLWLRWDSVRIASGDSVGVLVEHDAQRARREDAARVADVAVAMLLDDGSGSTTIQALVEKLTADLPPTEVPEPRDVVTKRVTRLLEQAAYASDGTRVVMTGRPPRVALG